MVSEQVKLIDSASMDILEEVGVVFRDERVHLDRGLVRELI